MTPRKSIVAVVTALSLFIALIAGSSLRPQFAAGALPEPAAWTHQTQNVRTPGGPERPDAVQVISRPGHGLGPGSTTTDRKPFHSMWMTRELPTSWPSLSPQSDWIALPASFAPQHLPSRHIRPMVAPFGCDGRDILMELCLIRC